MRRIKQHTTLLTKKGLSVKKITISLFLVLMAPTLSWGMQRKQLSIKPTKSRLQATRNRKNQLLLQAAQDGNFEQVETLAGKAEISFHEPETDASPFMVACEKGHLKIVKFLAKKLTTQEINERRGVGVTPVWLAAHKKRTACVRALVAAGADVTIPDGEGYLPIHMAADGTDLNLLSSLLRADAQTANAQNKHGVTPLHKACYKNNIDTVALLLTYGAKPELQDANGLSAFDYATSKKMRELLALGAEKRRYALRDAPEGDDMPPHYDKAAAQEADLAVTRVAWIAKQPEQN